MESYLCNDIKKLLLGSEKRPHLVQNDQMTNYVIRFSMFNPFPSPFTAHAALVINDYPENVE